MVWCPRLFRGVVLMSTLFRPTAFPEWQMWIAPILGLGLPRFGIETLTNTGCGKDEVVRQRAQIKPSSSTLALSTSFATIPLAWDNWLQM